jgi:hypothetical protein
MIVPQNHHEFIAENVPAALSAEKSWTLWHGEYRDNGKLHKEPRRLTGSNGSSTDPSAWTTFVRAVAHASKHNDYYGIGFVFAPESEYGGVDLDACLDPKTGEIKPWAEEIISSANTYAEVSPSGTGVKLVGRFKLPPMSGHSKKLNGETGEAVEVYDRGRFFTVTGRQLPGTPNEVRDIQFAVEGVLNRYFAKPQRTAVPSTLRKIRKLSEEEKSAATQAIADHLPESHLNDLALDLSGYLCRRTDRETVEDILIGAWDAHGLIKADGSGLRGIVERAEQRLADGDNTTGGPSLKERNPGMFEALEKALKRRGRPAAADELVRMGLSLTDELFTDQYKQPYALVDGASLPLDALGDLLAVQWFRVKNNALPQDSIRSALNTLAALARVEGEEHDLKTRWGRVGKTIYYETAPGRVWEIDADGWRRASAPPVRFRRLDLLRPLPDPVAGGTLEDLTEVVKLEGVSLRMYLSALASYPFEDVPRPALAIIGRQGGGKSTRTKVLKRLLDEDGSDFVSPQGDILRQATHRAVVAFDNQSAFPKDFSDLLSSLITGGGDSKRELYSNNREFAFKVMRPVVLNGINIPSDRPDLLERTVIVEVPDIRPEERETEHDFWTNFEEKRGVLLGVVFDLISGVLRNLRPLERRPRIADWSDYASALYAHTGWGRDQFQKGLGGRGGPPARDGPGEHPGRRPAEALRGVFRSGGQLEEARRCARRKFGKAAQRRSDGDEPRRAALLAEEPQHVHARVQPADPGSGARGVWHQARDARQGQGLTQGDRDLAQGQPAGCDAGRVCRQVCRVCRVSVG